MLKLFAKNYRAGSFFSVLRAHESEGYSNYEEPGVFSMASFLAALLLIPFQLILQSWWVSPLWKEIWGGDGRWYKAFKESWIFAAFLYPVNLGILLPLRAIFLGLMIIPGEIVNFFVSIFLTLAQKELSKASYKNWTSFYDEFHVVAPSSEKNQKKLSKIVNQWIAPFFWTGGLIIFRWIFDYIQVVYLKKEIQKSLDENLPEDNTVLSSSLDLSRYEYLKGFLEYLSCPGQENNLLVGSAKVMMDNVSAKRKYGYQKFLFNLNTNDDNFKYSHERDHYCDGHLYETNQFQFSLDKRLLPYLLPSIKKHLKQSPGASSAVEILKRSFADLPEFSFVFNNTDQLQSKSNYLEHVAVALRVYLRSVLWNYNKNCIFLDLLEKIGSGIFVDRVDVTTFFEGLSFLDRNDERLGDDQLWRFGFDAQVRHVMQYKILNKLAQINNGKMFFYEGSYWFDFNRIKAWFSESVVDWVSYNVKNKIELDAVKTFYNTLLSFPVDNRLNNTPWGAYKSPLLVFSEAKRSIMNDGHMQHYELSFFEQVAALVRAGCYTEDDLSDFYWVYNYSRISWLPFNSSLGFKLGMVYRACTNYFIFNPSITLLGAKLPGKNDNHILRKVPIEVIDKIIDSTIRQHFDKMTLPQQRPNHMCGVSVPDSEALKRLLDRVKRDGLFGTGLLILNRAENNLTLYVRNISRHPVEKSLIEFLVISEELNSKKELWFPLREEEGRVGSDFRIDFYHEDLSSIYDYVALLDPSFFDDPEYLKNCLIKELKDRIFNFYNKLKYDRELVIDEVPALVFSPDMPMAEVAKQAWRDEQYRQHPEQWALVPYVENKAYSAP